MRLRFLVAIIVAVGLAGSIGLAQGRPQFERVEGQWTLTAMVLGSCGDFDILYDTVGNEVDTFWPDQTAYWSCAAGDPTCPARWDYQLTRSGDKYTNSTDPAKYLWGSPGTPEHSSIRYAADGTKTMDMWEGNLWRVNVPHHGLIFAQVGRLSFLDGFAAAGHNQFFEADFAALCDALR